MSIIQAKCWAIFHELRLALAKNVTKLVIKTDSQQAIELITQDCPLHHECRQIIMAINTLIYQANHVSWGRIWREQNGLADSFAKFGLSLDQEAKFFDSIPSFALSFVDEAFSALAFS